MWKLLRGLCDLFWTHNLGHSDEAVKTTHLQVFKFKDMFNIITTCRALIPMTTMSASFTVKNVFTNFTWVYIRKLINLINQYVNESIEMTTLKSTCN